MPVGDFLDAVDFWRKVEGTFVFTHKTVSSANGFFQVEDPVYGWANQKVFGGASYKFRETVIDRNVTSSPDVPYPTLDSEIKKSATSLKRALDAVALFAVPEFRHGS